MDIYVCMFGRVPPKKESETGNLQKSKPRKTSIGTRKENGNRERT
jgi:hypothetical protein